MPQYKIGVIGGSGLYQMEGLKILEERRLETPFGKPSDAFILGDFQGLPVAFLPRHGRGHLISPTEINYRANIYAMKLLGVERIISVSAVGSMKEDLAPGYIVIVNQFVDRTQARPSTFFEKGIVAHVSFADPVCEDLIETLYDAAVQEGAKARRGGTYICIEGPMFSSRAESKIYRGWGVDVIGMTNYQEAKLAREAEICYVSVALVTDYDCWHQGHADVDATMVLETLKKNVETAKAILRRAIPKISAGRQCPCASALKYAIVTEKQKISPEVRGKLAPIIGKYL